MLVVGNPANTNCLIAAHNAGLGPTPLPPEQFAAMTRLDHNRAVGQVAARAGAPVASVTNVSIWGNHSATQYPDIFHAKVGTAGRLWRSVGGSDWVEKELDPDGPAAGRSDHRGPGGVERRFGRQRRR